MSAGAREANGRKWQVGGCGAPHWQRKTTGRRRREEWRMTKATMGFE